MTHEEILIKFKRGDFVLAGKMTRMTERNAQITFSRRKSKKYEQVKNALVKIIENRETLIIESVEQLGLNQ